MDQLNLHKTKISTIEDLVFAYQIIKNEQKTKKKILEVNIKFDQKKITNFLAQNKISYADVENISLTVLPVFIKDKNVFMYADNFFYNNWLLPENEIGNTKDTLVKYNLALEDVEDLQYINLNKEKFRDNRFKKSKIT